uniref:Putative WRKY transcription factor 4 n=1 Tax=Lilium longiflorum TaxID=4690 RepID=A0A6G8D993_LILLO|nr:putative WRKY transcription factor 4 [Lilium longiflorum]
MAAEAPSSDAPKPDSADTADAPSPPVATSPKLETPSPPPDPAPSADTDTAPPQPEALAAPVSSAGSFSQLLAGAMAPPVIAVPMVAVPCFIAPASMLESPTFTGQFAISHQAVLATVTAQAQMQLQAAQPSSSELRQSVLQSTISPVPLQQMPPPGYGVSVCTPRAEQTLSSDREPHSARSALKINHDDGYNWRKYGQKQVKSGVNSRSYYKCTSADCSAKKKVEQCPDGRVTEVSYRGQHSHDPPQQTRYSRERIVRSTGVLGENDSSELPRIESNESGTSTTKMEHKSGNETTEQQLFCSSDCEGDAAIKTEEDLGDEPDPKRRLSESTMQYSSPVIKTFREPRVVVQSASDIGRVSDGYRWRKYGQKTVKGNPNPRSYYRCTYNGCPVRKHVERASDDEKSILISYEGKHNHDLPGPKNNSDPPASPLISSAMTVTPGEQIPSSQSLPEQKPLELGGEKAPESALVVVSIGHNSSTGEDRECLNPPILNENSAAVPVENA